MRKLRGTCRPRIAPFDVSTEAQKWLWANLEQELMPMRVLCLCKPGTVQSDAPPTAEEQATMGKLIDDMAKAGVLLAVEGCKPSSYGSRVRIDGDKFSVTDGPFPETKELIAGFCLMQVKSMAEAVEWGKRFLAVAGCGESEILLLHDMPAG